MYVSSPCRFYNSFKGKTFTLIELLVVVSMIALLVSILIPALAKAKELAADTVCLSNQKTLVMAWIIYAEENDDSLVSGYPYIRNNTVGFVAHPKDDAVDPETGRLIWVNDDADAQEKAKIEACKQGELWPYLEAVDVFHCPGDKRPFRTPGVGFASGVVTPAFRSYSLPHGLNTDKWRGYSDYKTLADIKLPSDKFCFAEEDDPRGYNDNHWTQDPKDFDRWGDPVAVWHNEASTFSFCDGHAEMHKWLDPITTEIHENDHGWSETQRGMYDSPGSDDIRHVKTHYPWKK